MFSKDLNQYPLRDASPGPKPIKPMKSMLAHASRERSVSTLGFTIAQFLSFFLGSSSALLKDRRHAGTDEAFSPESHYSEMSANDLTGTACDISNEEQMSSSEISSYALTPNTHAPSFPQSFKCQLHLCTFNAWNPQQLELIDQTNQIISVSKKFRKVNSLPEPLIFNQ